MKTCGTCSSFVSCVWYLAAAALATGVGRAHGFYWWWCSSSLVSQFDGESPRSGLHWLYLAMVFYEVGLSPGLKPKIWQRQCLCIFPSWKRCFWRIYSMVWVMSSLMVQVLLLWAFDHRYEVFVFAFSPFYFLLAMCTLDVFDIKLGRCWV
jgi:hypothetical protein